ncbi:MAG: hypothetical protein ACLT98_07295 [Eggerthellaceae bacterium]
MRVLLHGGRAAASRAGSQAPTANQEASEESAVTPEQQKVIDGEEGITNADIDENAYPARNTDGLYDRWEALGEGMRLKSAPCRTGRWCSARPPSTR